MGERKSLRPDYIPPKIPEVGEINEAIRYADSLQFDLDNTEDFKSLATMLTNYDLGAVKEALRITISRIRIHDVQEDEWAAYATGVLRNITA